MTKKKTAANSKKTAAKKTKKVVGKPFQKGKSGNPSGRPKKDQALAEAAREAFHSINGLKRIANIAMTAEKESDQLKAIDVLLDRGWGKAPQEIKLGGSDDDKLAINVIINKK